MPGWVGKVEPPPAQSGRRREVEVSAGLAVFVGLAGDCTRGG